MRRTWVFAIAGSVAVLFALPSAAYANAGLPMLAIAWPGMGVALLPVVAIEVLVLRRLLRAARWRTVLVASVSNAVSTVVGIPLTWLVLVAAQMLTPSGGGVGPDIGTLAGKVFAVTVQAPWLIPYDAQLYWMVPAAALALLVPFFFASWAIEYGVTRLMMREFGAGPVRRAVMWANLASYGLLATGVAGLLAVAIVTGRSVI